MKHSRLFNSFAALALSLFASATAFADNEVTFSVDKAYVQPGETATLTLNFKNTEKVTAISGRIILPQGLTFVAKEGETTDYVCGTTELSAKANCSLGGKSNQNAQFDLSKLTAFKPGDGAFMTFMVKADDTFAAVDSIKMTELKGCIAPAGVLTTYEQADFKTPVYNKNNEIHPSIADFSIKAGETKTISMDLNFDKLPLNALEYKYSLPEGLTIVEDSYKTTERTSDFDFLESLVPNRVILIPAILDPDLAFVGTEGSILTFDVKAAEDFKDGKMVIKDFMASGDPDGVKAKTFYATDLVVNVTKDNTSTGINGVEENEADQYDAVYSVNGVRTNGLKQGVNIVVKNGKAVKVIKK